MCVYCGRELRVERESKMGTLINQRSAEEQQQSGGLGRALLHVECFRLIILFNYYNNPKR